MFPTERDWYSVSLLRHKTNSENLNINRIFLWFDLSLQISSVESSFHCFCKDILADFTREFTAFARIPMLISLLLNYEKFYTFWQIFQSERKFPAVREKLPDMRIEISRKYSTYNVKEGDSGLGCTLPTNWLMDRLLQKIFLETDDQGVKYNLGRIR